MKRWTGIIIGSLLLAWIISPGVPRLWGAKADRVERDLTQKKRDLSKVKKELSLTKEKEKEIRGKESSVLGSLSAIEMDLDKKGKELKEKERQLSEIKDQRQETKQQIAMLNLGMEQTRGELFSRLTALYKMGRISPETLLLTSRSYLDLLQMDKFLKVIIDSDARILEAHRYQVVLKERYQEALLQSESQWQRSISAVQAKREEVKRVGEEKRALLKSIQNQKVVYQRVIGELEGRAKDLQGFIEKLEKARAEKLEKEKATLAYAKPRGEPIKGKLIPPVQGKVISFFKEKGQNGIEIKVPTGTEIRAVLPGKVLYADWFKGFGNIVVIDHGDHIFTVSGYSSQLLKKEGDTVAQGEPIALVGSAGSLKGPCLYFEIRRNGKPEDPMQWIPNQDKIVSLPEAKEKGKREM